MSDVNMGKLPELFRLSFELDQMYLYQNFMPHYNFDVVINYLEKIKLIQLKKRKIILDKRK
jgi:hypothetical protein